MKNILIIRDNLLKIDRKEQESNLILREHDDDENDRKLKHITALHWISRCCWF